MFRRSKRIAAGIAVCGLVGASAAAQPASGTAEGLASSDPLEQLLERHGLEDLIVVHLENELRQALGDDRIPIVQRLAVLYGSLLDMATTDDQRKEWEQRSRRLLDEIPEADTGALRLNIYKAAYLRAEQDAELHRLAALTEARRAEAERAMLHASTGLEELYETLSTEVSRLEGLRAEPTPERADALRDELARLDALVSQAAYFGAWSTYYHAFLSGQNERLDHALFLFGRILGIESGVPVLGDLPQEMLAYPHIARSALGVTLCLAQQGNFDAALDWLGATDYTETHVSVREQLPTYRAYLLAAAGRWEPLEDVWDQLEGQRRLTPLVARLVAVQALSTAQRPGATEGSRRVAITAVTALADMGRLDQLVELAEVFNLEVLGQGHFSLAYLHGLTLYEQARQRHGNEYPVKEPEIVKGYDAAKSALTAALSRRDGESLPEARENALLLSGWCDFFSSRFEAAARAFAEAATKVSASKVEDARWLEVTALDYLSREEPTAENRRRMTEALSKFVDDFPSSRRAGRALVRNAADPTSTLDPEQRVKMLLDVPRGSEAYADARTQLEQIVYSLFSQTRGLQRINHARQYVDIVLPMSRDDYLQAFSGSVNEAARDRYLLRARRLMDCMLTRGVARIHDARELLDRLQTGAAAGLLSLEGLDAELQYRRFQIVMLSGNMAEAQAECDALWASAPSNPFTLAAHQELFYAHTDELLALPGEQRSEEEVSSAILLGRRLMDLRGAAFDLSAKGPPSDAMLAHQLSRLIVESPLWQTDTELTETAVELASGLLEGRPDEVQYQRIGAEIAEREGRISEALEAWRQLSLAHSEGDPEWYEARYHFARLLAQVEPDHARQVLDQFRLLHPDLGGEPWAERFEALMDSLNVAEETEAPNEPEEEGP